MSLNNPTVGIIGGTGKMGGWLASVLEAQSFRTLKVGRDRAVDLSTLAQICQVVVVSVPVTETTEVILRVGPHMAEDSLLMDLTSVKKVPLAAMLGRSRSQVVGAHPLFGPGGAGQEHGRVVLCPGRGEEGLRWAKELFERAGMEVVLMDPDTHDRLMAMIQGVQHFVTLSLALTLHRSGLDPKTIEQCATPTFRAALDRISAMTRQAPHLFESLLMDNGYAPPLIGAYLENAGGLYRIITEEDREAFQALFHDLRKRFHKE